MNKNKYDKKFEAITKTIVGLFYCNDEFRKEMAKSKETLRVPKKDYSEVI